MIVMRSRLLLILSLAINLVLAAVWLASRRHATLSPAPNLTPPRVGTNPPQTRVIVRKQFFSWQELESSDYPTYIANLRDIACPEQTIRDIIIADVNQVYLRKRWAEVPTPEQEWWRSEPDTNTIQAANAKLAALDQQRRALLTSLLGPNWDIADAPPPSVVALNGPILGELSPEVKNSVQDIITRSQQRGGAYLDAQKTAGKPADPTELARLGQQTRNELAQVLTPPQLEEFLLRYSQTAAILRDQLRGVEVTPDEFRRLFDLSDPVEQQLQFVNPDLPGGAAEQTTYAKQLIDALKSVLGPDRYQSYHMGQDPAYRDAVNLADEAGAPPDAIPKLYSLNQAIQQQQSVITNNPSLTDDQKAAQLAALQQQQQDAADQILGLAPPAPATPPTPPVPAVPAPVAVHPYSPGETVDQIAAQYGVPAASILLANPNLDFNGLQRGTPINIPARPQP